MSRNIVRTLDEHMTNTSNNTVQINDVEPIPEQEPTYYDSIKFSDGTVHYIRTEWKLASPLLASGKILFEDSNLFTKYVVPILKDEMIRSVDCDETHEISTIIKLCNSYGIQISDAQIINIADSFNLQQVINNIRHLTEDVNSVFHWQIRGRFKMFKEFFDRHIVLLARLHKNPLFEKLTTDEIMNTLLNLSYLEIAKINFKYDNIYYKFYDYLKKAIVDKSFDEIIETNLKLQFTINGGIVDAIGDGFSFVSQIVAMIPEEYKKKVGNIILEKVKNISVINDLMK